MDFHRTLGKSRNSRCSQMSRNPIREMNIGNRQVFVLPQQTMAVCIYRSNWTIYQTQNQIDVVNHQVQYDADIGTSPRIHPFASRFDPTNRLRIDSVNETLPHRIEPLDMPDLQWGLKQTRKRLQLPSLGNTAGDRFLNERGNSSLQCPLGNFMMHRSRRCNHHRIDDSLQTLMGFDNRQTQLLANPAS